MKLTKRQILKIIREEFGGKDVARAFGAMADHRDEEEAILNPDVDVETVIDAWAGGENIVDPIDYQEVTTGEPTIQGIEIEEISERISRKLRIKRLIREMDWMDPMAFLDGTEEVEKAWASGDRISLMIDQPGLVGEVEPAADNDEEDELAEKVARAFGLSTKKLAEQNKNPEAEAGGEEESDTPVADSKTSAGKKAGKALDKSSAAPLLAAINDAGSEAAVEEILTQLIAQLSDDGKKYVKKAMTDIIRAQ